MSAAVTAAPAAEAATADVLKVEDVGADSIRTLAHRYGLELVMVPDGVAIPASYWGGREAGLRGRRLYLRFDTPVHSALHELAHFVCMDEARRAALDRDAGGEFAEEDAVCFLQILLADEIHGAGRSRMLRDMDVWGYTFRLGSARAWFEQDADDAAAWLAQAMIIDTGGRPTGCCRERPARMSEST